MRDKLIELINGMFDGDCCIDVADAADHLIANGVTVQQWIPVSERLPEIYTHVLVHIPWEKPFTAVHEGWLCPHGDWYADGFTRTPREVTHWMPMPKPPKENE